MTPFPKADWWRAGLLGLVPLLLLLCGVRTLPPEQTGESLGQRQVFQGPPFRTVVLLLDSLGTPVAFDPGLMPFVSSLRSVSLFGEARACPGKATFPCVKSIFEGRTATTGTTLQDFSAVVSQRTTWPRSLAALGLRLVLTSDHTINRLYPDAFVDALNYETLPGPLLERDQYAYARARQWLDDPKIDVLLLHILGTDKVGHDYEVGGEVYRAKFLEADNFVREIAGRLGPQDHLYVIGDHGHNRLGGHTEDAAYLARGPLFPQGRNENLGAADMLFLLSVPYGLTMPAEYEGHIRTDLTLLPNEVREKWLAEQARIWRVPAEGLAAEELEGRLNQHAVRYREEGQRAEAITTAVRMAPWLLASALFLFSQLRPPTKPNFVAVLIGLGGLSLGLAGFAFGGWLAVTAALWLCFESHGLARTGGALLALAALTVAGFWFLPSMLSWFHLKSHQAIGWTVFYPLAVAVGVAVTIALGRASLVGHAVRVLAVIGLAIWFFAYFGPYNYALQGRGAKIVLGILAPLAIILAGGWRPLISLPALCLAAFLPFILTHTSSFNINYKLIDAIVDWPPLTALLLCWILGILLLLAPNERKNWLRAVVGGAIWIFIGNAVFQFEPGKLLGCILGGLAFFGFVELFRRAHLPSIWPALAGALVLFAVFHFVLNGFALSHVDFRFATNKIIPFQEEFWRAPQLIVWVVIKYFFALTPVFFVLFTVENSVALQILQLGWWRELMIVLSALGLAIFDTRGLNELCSEEIYFWTFLNLALWLFCLALTWFRSREKLARAPGEEKIPVTAET